jgi:hypothetical protein
VGRVGIWLGTAARTAADVNRLKIFRSIMVERGVGWSRGLGAGRDEAEPRVVKWPERRLSERDCSTLALWAVATVWAGEHKGYRGGNKE